MKNFYNSKLLIVLGIGFSFLNAAQSIAQCSIVGLPDTYCAGSDAAFLTGSPAGGTFSGPGVAGGMFDPIAAGVGTHTITYEFFSGTDRYYIKSNIGDPWFNTSNNTAMNLAFGADWILESFETCDVATVFSVSTSFVFLDGSDNQASELSSFLAANLPTIEAWVAAGGSILINSAPNEGGSFSFGFGGTMLNYTFFSPNVTVVDLSHPALLGPNLPTSSSMTGGSYGHARITGSGYTTVLDYAGNMILAEKDWGSGHVMCGGMTTVNYHSPSPAAQNWRANLFVYMDEYIESGVACVVTQDVTVLDEFAPEVIAESDVDEICLGGSYTLTGSGADEFYWGGGIVDGASITPAAAGTYTHLLTGVSPSGCIGTDAVTVIVHPTPIVSAGLNQAQCTGSELTLNGAGASTYEWSPAITDGEPFVVASGETTYTVTGTDEFGCVGSDEVIVSGIDYPAITAVVTDEYALYGASIDLTVTGGSGIYGYTWSHGPTTEDVTGLYEGSYMVTVDDIGVADGICTVVDSIFVIKRFVGVDELNGQELLVYPTPTNDNITIAMKGNFTYELAAINGEVLVNGSAVDQKILSLAEFAAGTYLVNVTTGADTKTIKVVKN